MGRLGLTLSTPHLHCELHNDTDAWYSGTRDTAREGASLLGTVRNREAPSSASGRLRGSFVTDWLRNPSVTQPL